MTILIKTKPHTIAGIEIQGSSGAEGSRDRIEDGVKGKVLFDIKDRDFWLLRDDTPSWHETIGFSIMGMLIALIIFAFVPAIPNMVRDPSILLENPGGLLVLAFFIGLIIFLPRILFTSVDKLLRLTDRGFVIEIWRMTSNRYKTVPYSRLSGISLDDWYGTDFNQVCIEYIDDEGRDQQASFLESDRDLDVLGMVDAFKKMVPDGPQPTVEEFLEMARESFQWHEGHNMEHPRARGGGKDVMMLVPMYFALFVIPLMSFTFYEYGGMDLMTISSAIAAVIIYICLCLIVLTSFVEFVDSFLDKLERGFKVKKYTIHVPRTTSSHLFLSVRHRLTLDEIREVRPHLILRPLSLATMLVDSRGKAFLVKKDVLSHLEGDTRFQRVGWKLINRNMAPEDLGPIASWNWWKVRTLLCIPASVYIIGALYKLLTLL
jgi:hypothetical protein